MLLLLLLLAAAAVPVQTAPALPLLRWAGTQPPAGVAGALLGSG
jgi:hypothetical protein